MNQPAPDQKFIRLRQLLIFAAAASFLLIVMARQRAHLSQDGTRLALLAVFAAYIGLFYWTVLRQRAAYARLNVLQRAIAQSANRQRLEDAVKAAKRGMIVSVAIGVFAQLIWGGGGPSRLVGLAVTVCLVAAFFFMFRSSQKRLSTFDDLEPHTLSGDTQ